MEEKAKKLCGIIFAAVVAVGLVLAIVGLFGDVVSVSTIIGSMGYGVFNELWDLPGAPSTAFVLIALIVTVVGLALALVGAILRVFVKKNIKMLDFIGGALAIVGGILALVAGIMLASDTAGDMGSVGYGAILALVGGLIGGVCAILPQVGPFKA